VDLNFARIWFVLSLVALSFVYGAAVGKWQWFPYSFLDQAVEQARTVKSQLEENSPGVFLVDQVYEREGVRSPQPGKMQPGLTLISSLWKESDGWSAVKLFDEKGRVVHSWQFDWEEAFPGGVSQRGGLGNGGVHGVYLLPKGDIVVNNEYVGMARVNACGQIRWTLEEGNHHSIHRAEDGSFWVPGVSSEPRGRSERHPDGFPGLQGKKVWVDRILQISEEGKILNDINVLDILYKNDLERYIPKVLGGHRPTPEKVTKDLTHLNDVETLGSSIANEYPLFEAGDLLVSLRSLSLVFVFDPDTGEVKWQSSEPFIYQHDPDFVGNGKIGVFDNNHDLTNRGNMLGGSRVVFLHPSSDSIEVQFPTSKSDPLYTRIQGKWQQLDNGNMLLAESTAGRVAEVDPSGRTVWEWVHEAYDSKVPSVTKATRHDLTREDVADWPCSSVDSVGAAARSN
jgi:hypothetical protein